MIKIAGRFHGMEMACRARAVIAVGGRSVQGIGRNFAGPTATVSGTKRGFSNRSRRTD